MTIQGRLLRLERAFRRIDVPIVAHALTLTDDEEADRLGELLWTGFAGRMASPHLGASQTLHSPALRTWREAAETAWSAGHRTYPIALRPFSLAVWLEWKPDIVKHRETHGVWAPIGEPKRAETITIEEFNRLPLSERSAILRDHRPGGVAGARANSICQLRA